MDGWVRLSFQFPGERENAISLSVRANLSAPRSTSSRWRTSGKTAERGGLIKPRRVQLPRELSLLGKFGGTFSDHLIASSQASVRFRLSPLYWKLIPFTCFTFFLLRFQLDPTRLSYIPSILILRWRYRSMLRDKNTKCLKLIVTSSVLDLSKIHGTERS